MGLEQASEALHESLNEESDTTVKPEESTDQATDENKSELVDLSSLAKFRFEGKDWTIDDLKKSILMQSDYTRKTQALAQERQTYQQDQKFAANLKSDLEFVLQNPDKVAEFKQVYPEKYHGILDVLLSRQQVNNQNPQGPKETPSVNPVLENRLTKMEKILLEQERQTYEAKVEATNAAIDQVFTKMNAKYPFVDEEVVISRAQALHEKAKAEGNPHLLVDEQGNQKADAWDKIFKSVNENAQKRYESHYKKQVTEQKTANGKGKDIASGGGIPGQAPKRMTIREASEHAIATLSNR